MTSYEVIVDPGTRSEQSGPEYAHNTREAARHFIKYGARHKRLLRPMGPTWDVQVTDPATGDVAVHKVVAVPTTDYMVEES